MAKRNKHNNNIYDAEYSNDITPLPQNSNDFTPQGVLPIVGGLMTKNMVEMGEEMLVDEEEDLQRR